ncbi:MAG: hypothetical protein PUG64_05325 [Bacteroidales bacterium]|nr:hypothetical protein [Bacteroidales bacterium]
MKIIEKSGGKNWVGARKNAKFVAWYAMQSGQMRPLGDASTIIKA